MNTTGIINQNMANSLAAHGLNPAVAQNSVGLSITSMALDENGNITNFKAESAGHGGKSYNVTEAGIEARHTALANENISGFGVVKGTNVTEKFDRDGNLIQVGLEGGGFTRFSSNMETGYTSGTHAFEANGINYTQSYSGNERTTTFMDKTGDMVTRQEARGSDGAFHTSQTDITVGKNGYNIDGINFQTGSTISQGADGVMTANGVFSIGERDFSGKITTDASGNIVNITGENGQTLSKNDIDNLNYGRQSVTNIGNTLNIGNQDIANMAFGDAGTWRKDENYMENSNERNMILQQVSAYNSNLMSETRQVADQVKLDFNAGIKLQGGFSVLGNEATVNATGNTSLNTYAVDSKNINSNFADLMKAHEGISNNASLSLDEKAEARAAIQQSFMQEAGVYDNKTLFGARGKMSGENTAENIKNVVNEVKETASEVKEAAKKLKDDFKSKL